jgi:AAA+ ATPase superfamily predicted ATPase
MDKFINRIDEMKALKEEYAKPSSTFTVIYGRRRVGKTSLIAEFLKDKPNVLYFLATKESETMNKATFKKQVAEFVGNQLLETAAADWFDIFKHLIIFKTDTKKIIVIDEFQFIGMSNPAFPSIFQRIWDMLLMSANIMVIICGSLVNMMTTQTLSYTSPLYGRRTSQIKLKQVTFPYIKDFLPNCSFEDLVLFYAVTGGVPKYIETVADSKNVFDAIENKILNKQSYLYEEPQFLLSQEVNEVGSYFSIIKAIAFGNRKLNDIATVISKKATDMTKYLKTLIDLDLIEREVPITEDYPEKSKKGLYRLKDNFISFWFRYVYTNQSHLEKGEQAYVLEQIKKSFVDNHVSFVYEDVCREKMWEFNATNKWDFRFNKLGRYWDSNTEIDIVGIDSVGKNIILGECKYSKSKKGVDVLNDLKKKEPVVLRGVQGWKVVSYVLFCKAGFTDELVKLTEKNKTIVLISQ